MEAQMEALATQNQDLQNKIENLIAQLNINQQQAQQNHQQQQNQIEALMQQISEKDKLISNLSEQIKELTGRIGGCHSGSITPKPKRIHAEPLGNDNKRGKNLNGTFSCESIASLDTNIANNNNGILSASSLNGETTSDESTESSEMNNNWTTVTYRSKKMSNNNNTNGINSTNEKRVSPIILEKMDTDKQFAVHQLLLRHFSINDFIWHQVKKVGSPKIMAKNFDIKTKITNTLRDNMIQFNTFADTNNRKKSFVLRGIQFGDDSDNFNNISAALHAAGVTDCAEVSTFKTGFHKANPEVDSARLYKITVPNDVDSKKITNIQSINHFGVKFERQKPNKQLQCHNCQRYQHSARQCGYVYRCVQCTNNHGPFQCPRISNKSIPVSCVNCIAAGLDHMGHTANNLRECKFYAEFLKNQDKRKTAENASISNKTSTSINGNSVAVGGKSFASIIKNTSTNFVNQRNSPAANVYSNNNQGESPFAHVSSAPNNNKQIWAAIAQQFDLMSKLLVNLTNNG